MPINIPDLKSKIITYIGINGPCLPVQLSKQIHSNILFAGAVLSELVANKKIRISHAKVGGSPVYYINGQEHKLSMLYSHLHERERKAYDLLKENKVLYDRALEPWQRVALRDLNDFAYPIQINDNIFWRWYLISEEEAQKLIQEYLEKNSIQENKQVESNELKQEIKPEPIKQEILKIEPIKQELQLIKQEIILNPVLEQKKLEIKNEEVEVKKPVIKKVKKIKKESNEFYSELNNYLQRKKINKLNEEIIKKNKEFELTVNAPSSLGLIKFLIFAKDKKKISDADLSLAHNKAQLKKLPLIFVSNGDLDKKAKEYIEKNYLIFEKI